MYFTLDCLKNT